MKQRHELGESVKSEFSKELDRECAFEQFVEQNGALTDEGVTVHAS